MDYTDKWLIKEDVYFEDGVPLVCYNLVPTDDENIRNEWSEHIRRHYISDEKLDESLKELNMDRKDYLKKYCIPQPTDTLGPTAISGDITEILVSDILEFKDQFVVPRIKCLDRSGKCLPEHGSDVIAYKFFDESGKISSSDKLIIAEVKASLSIDSYDPIKKAILDSNKKDCDEQRYAHTLNYYRNKLKLYGQNDKAQKIARFQLKTEYPYQKEFIPAAIISMDKIELNSVNSRKEITLKAQDIDLRKDTKVFLIYGKDLMNLAYDIYRRICIC